MERACTCNNIPPPGEPYTAKYCVRCWMWHRHSDYRLEAQTTPPSLLRRAINFGAAVGQHIKNGFRIVHEAIRLYRLSVCDSCNAQTGRGLWDAKNRRCNHAKCGCNMDVKAGWAEQSCPIRRWSSAIKGKNYSIPYSGPVIRHLAYHIAPFKSNGTWQRNIKQLKEHLHIFNGRRIVAIVTGPSLDKPDMVKRALGDDVEYLVLNNDPRLREVVTFMPLLTRVLSHTGFNDITFYAHAKGVTRPVNPGVTVHYWTDLMYQSCLDYMPVVEKMLVEYPIVGSFKKVGAGFAGSMSSWHWSGSFWWMRNCHLLGRNWQKVDQQWWGNESWPGLHFHPDEAGALLITGRVPSLDLYDMRYLRDVAMPAYVKFKDDHKNERTAVNA